MGFVSETTCSKEIDSTTLENLKKGYMEKNNAN